MKLWWFLRSPSVSPSLSPELDIDEDNDDDDDNENPLFSRRTLFNLVFRRFRHSFDLGTLFFGAESVRLTPFCDDFVVDLPDFNRVFFFFC